MPPPTFRASRDEERGKNTPFTPKRKPAIFRDGGSPVAKQQRTFGTDITNSVGNLRPVFKQGERARPSEPAARPLELLKSPRRQTTPVKFIEARQASAAPSHSLGSSPLAKSSATQAPLAALIEARCLELKTRAPLAQVSELDAEACEPYNAVCALRDDTVIMNPRQIPWDHAQVYGYSDRAWIAGIW